MHTREALADDGGDWRDTMHLVVAGLSTLHFFSMMAAGAFAFGRWFRGYSFATIALMLVAGSLMNLEVAGVASDELTPWLGVYERLAVEGAMLWEAVFAAALLRRTRNEPVPAAAG